MRNFSFSETDFHHFWLNSPFLNQILTTTNGIPLEIIRRGQHNADAGPDFKNVVLRINQKIIEGDCELHLDAADWVNHGHHTDPKYNDVVLHVHIAEASQIETKKENGLSLLCLQIFEKEVLHFLDSKTKKIDGKERKYACPLSGENATKKELTVNWAGVLRIQQKAEIASENYQSKSWDQLVYEGICTALGYEKNSKAFLQLTQIVPIDLIFQEIRDSRDFEIADVIGGLLFGAAGFLNDIDRKQKFGEIYAYTGKMMEYWDHCHHILQLKSMRREEWQFFRLRPQNFPTRRIAGVVRLLEKLYHVGIVERLISIIENRELKIQQVIFELRQFFIIQADTFWQHHFDFQERESLAQNSLGDLIGKNRADDLIVNIILPSILLYSSESHSAQLKNRVMEIYASYPSLQENKITKSMIEQLNASGEKMDRRRNGARFQQGLLHLQKLYCRDLRCDECLRLTQQDGVAEMDSSIPVEA